MHPATQEKIKGFSENYPAKKFSAHVSLQDLTHDGKCFYVESGKVRLYAVGPCKKDFTIHIFEKGQLCPLRSILQNCNNHHLDTYTECTLRIIPITAAKNFVSHNIDVTNAVNDELITGLENMILRLAQAYYCQANYRIIVILIYLSNKFGQKQQDANGNFVFSRKFTHDELASLTGLSRETVSRELEKLKKKKIIDIRYKQIYILKKDELVNLAEQTPYFNSDL